MLSTNRKYLLAGIAALLLILFGLTFLIKDEPPPKPAPPIEDVRMPPPPPQPTPEQIAAAQAAARALAAAVSEQAKVAEEEARKAEKASQKAAAEKRAVSKPAVQKKAPVEIAKPVEVQTATPAAQAPADPAKPKNARFNMTQDGKKMTAEDFDAWMKSQGIRIVPAKTAEPATPPAEEKKDDGGR